MQKVGLCGNIGSGKTTVAGIFRAMGAFVFHADDMAKQVLLEKGVLQELMKRFGPQILDENHQLNRKLLASYIFNDTQSLAFVSNLVHPKVRQAYHDFCSKNRQAPVCIYEAAILIETGFYKELNKTILVTAPEKTRIQRVMQRDNISQTEVVQRTKNQWPEERKIPYADFIIVNDGNNPLLEQCLAVYQRLAL